MAIIMDGHEIDTLELHGSNGQVLTVQLTEQGGTVDLSGVVACLQDILALLRLATYANDEEQHPALLAQLAEDIAELSGDVAIEYDGDTANISRLAGIGITYDGETAVIGG